MTETDKPKKRRGGARDAMKAKRSKPPEIDPAPPGAVGGQYRPLTERQVQQIYDTSLRMLAELGMGDSPQALTDQAVKCGATINELGRLCFSRDMVEGIIDGACKSFVFHGRDEKHTIEVGGDRVYFGHTAEHVVVYTLLCCDGRARYSGSGYQHRLLSDAQYTKTSGH